MTFCQKRTSFSPSTNTTALCPNIWSNGLILNSDSTTSRFSPGAWIAVAVALSLTTRTRSSIGDAPVNTEEWVVNIIYPTLWASLAEELQVLFADQDELVFRFFYAKSHVFWSFWLFSAGCAHSDARKRRPLGAFWAQLSSHEVVFLFYACLFH